MVVPADDVERVVAWVQGAMRSDAPFSARFHGGREPIVVFERELSRFGLDPATWEPARRCGREVLATPADQLDFRPVRFDDEAECFSVARGRIDRGARVPDREPGRTAADGAARPASSPPSTRRRAHFAAGGVSTSFPGFGAVIFRL